MKVSIVIPAYNEEACVEKVVSHLKEALCVEHEIVIVNDHSSDRTKEVVRELQDKYKNIVLVDNKDARGFANALRAGFKSAAGEFIVPVMADLADEPETINKMFDKIAQGFDVVCGSRYMKGGRKIGGPFLKTACSFLAGKFIYLLGVPTQDITNSFKMYKRQVIEAVDSRAASFEISMEIPLKAHLKGFKITEIPTTWRCRSIGKSNFKAASLIPVYLRLYFWFIAKNLLKIFRPARAA